MIPPALLDAIVAAFDDWQSDAAGAVRDARSRFAGLPVLRCDASDVHEPPFRRGRGLDLHLTDVSAHCVRVVSDPADASGILLSMH